METKMTTQVVVVGLQQLFDPTKWFDICRVQVLCKLVGAHLTPQQDALFGVMHCVHYNTMPAGLREQLAEEVVRVLQQTMPSLDFSVHRPATTVTAVAVVTTENPSPQPRGLRKLLGL